MDESGEAPARRGRLHGRLLHVLGGFSALVALAALWQFGVFGGDPDRDPVGTVDGPETDWLSLGDEDTSTAEAPATPSATAESPSESSAAPTSEAPSESTSAAAEATSAHEETREEEEEPPSGASCSATLTLDEEWGDEVDVTVAVVNTGGDEFASWTIDLDIDDADIYHHWNMRELGHDRYGNEDWNGRLDPGEDAVVGFQAETDRGFELPDSVPCEASG